ncbi:hypothetical protein [Synechococcus sp. MVIR-18-1]|uniref:hypothetical protein n=1 Tax=Synechococcus sp. MVIR-18-1 TaxID=1386941 RepID=UPI0016450D68|nr:hypothetical protein [Synechococcus sp. MVIR-18-1]QNI75170.1 hypothetical protein SynMVIR181_00156 [Synechococcus sp. MVIR-18-1]
MPQKNPTTKEIDTTKTVDAALPRRGEKRITEIKATKDAGITTIIYLNGFTTKPL